MKRRCHIYSIRFSKFWEHTDGHAWKLENTHEPTTRYERTTGIRTDVQPRRKSVTQLGFRTWYIRLKKRQFNVGGM